MSSQPVGNAARWDKDYRTGDGKTWKGYDSESPDEFDGPGSEAEQGGQQASSEGSRSQQQNQQGSGSQQQSQQGSSQNQQGQTSGSTRSSHRGHSTQNSRDGKSKDPKITKSKSKKHDDPPKSKPNPQLGKLPIVVRRLPTKRSQKFHPVNEWQQMERIIV
ncbi:hypothetical protein DL95DRAFT_411689 [Leptodontidium sp. 2 PMI_412]|nr:hypothetical protein DL95DRAFT_411689 [Leptodontidium sp. 2 PMI_412]